VGYNFSRKILILLLTFHSYYAILLSTKGRKTLNQKGTRVSKKKKTTVRDSYEVNRSIRRDWGAISPVTKVIPDKRDKKPKHKKGWDEE